MQRENCKPGTEVTLRVIVLKDDGGYHLPIKVSTLCRCVGGDNYSFWVNPESLSPITDAPKYDPTRTFRKGDLVKVVGYHGRLFGNGRVCTHREYIGKEFTLENDELGGDVKIAYSYISVACVELVKSVEDIATENAPYYVDCGSVKRRKDDAIIVTFSYVKLGHEEATLMAQEFCDKLNSKHLESLKA